MKKKQNSVSLMVSFILGLIGITFLVVSIIIGLSHIGSSIQVITIVFFCVGIGMVIAALIPLLLATNKKKKVDYLKQNGYTIEATVSEINMNYNLTVNGRHPYVVYCIYEDIYSGVQHRFKSGNIWNNPEPIIQQGTVLKVYVNSHNDFSKYYVDVENALEGKIVDYT